ncbi:MAG: hypothetical protein QOD99_114 [Chthoniobacter sp.]|jgi:hypothetical protein|nr:hypothetical protein [Chthoniobacter sp.]
MKNEIIFGGECPERGENRTQVNQIHDAGVFLQWQEIGGGAGYTVLL